MAEKNLILRGLTDYFNNETFIHIVCNSFHYNGWIIDMDNTHIRFKDKKTNTILIFKITDITLLEKREEL